MKFFSPIILILVGLFIMGSLLARSTHIDEGALPGLRICPSFGSDDRSTNSLSGYTLCRIQLGYESSLFGIAIFYDGALFEDKNYYEGELLKSGTFYDDFRGIVVPKVISIRIKMKGEGEFLTFRMKTRKNNYGDYYAQLIIHTQKSFTNEHSGVVFKEGELPDASKLFQTAFESDGTPKEWNLEFYFKDEQNKADNTSGFNFSATLDGHRKASAPPK